MAIKGSSQAVNRREHDLTNKAKRMIPVDPFGGDITDGGNYSEQQDISVVGTETTIYSGVAQIGTATSSPSWQIKKTVIDEDTGTLISVTWADSTDEFIKVWDDRATYTYA